MLSAIDDAIAKHDFQLSSSELVGEWPVNATISVFRKGNAVLDYIYKNSPTGNGHFTTRLLVTLALGAKLTVIFDSMVSQANYRLESDLKQLLYGDHNDAGVALLEPNNPSGALAKMAHDGLIKRLDEVLGQTPITYDIMTAHPTRINDVVAEIWQAYEAYDPPQKLRPLAAFSTQTGHYLGSIGVLPHQPYFTIACAEDPSKQESTSFIVTVTPNSSAAPDLDQHVLHHAIEKTALILG